MKIIVNGTSQDLGTIDPETPLLWVLRDTLGLVGTKFGCGIAQCGACTVQIDGRPVRSCVTQVKYVGDRQVKTIEGLATADNELSALQQAWVDLDVAQCGYCQAGQLMTADALLSELSDPTPAQIDAAMAGNICRCGTYLRIRAAIQQAVVASNSEE